MVHANKQRPLSVQYKPYFKHGLIMSCIAPAFRQEYLQIAPQ